MGRNEIFFRKQFIDSIDFSENSVAESNSVTTDKEAKVVYKTGGKTQVCVGKVTESDSYYYVELDNHQQRIIMKNCVLSIKDVERGKSDKKKKDWTNRVRIGRKSNGFSYSKWWSREHVEEVE